MSDNILPRDVQLEIMKRLPVKSLIQFRSVSKAWYSLITTSDFILAHHRQNKTPHLLVWYEDDDIATIVDDVTFPNHKAPLVPPQLLNNVSCHRVLGCSSGLLCFFGESSSVDKEWNAVIWNISIRKEVSVVLHHGDRHDIALGFGVCPENNDPTIVKMLRSTRQVDVFKLSTGVWRSLGNINTPPIRSMCVQVQGCLYWLVTQEITLNGGLTSNNLIVSFDIKTEEFKLVKLPDTLAYRLSYKMSHWNLRESLVVCECEAQFTSNIWRMEDGVPNTFTKLFSFYNNLYYEYASVEGFRNNGKPIIQISEYDDDEGDYIHKLVVYDPSSEHIESLGINKTTFVSCVHPYKETLLLLDQPNLKVYNQQMEI